MSRLKRFLHLERPRRGGAGRGAPETGAPSRFGALEERQGPPPAPAETGAGRRFEAPALPDTLELAAASPGEQPFVRCCRCEADAGRYEAACPRCGAALHTEEQRLFNARLWEARQAEAAVERAAAERLEEERARAAAEAAQARRKAAELLAREAARALEDRLAADGLGSWAGRPLLLRLLERIPDRRWRLAAAAGFALAGAALLAGALRARSAGAVLALLAAAAVLLGPGLRRRG